MATALAIYHLALALWIGGIALFTFVVTPTIFRSRGRDDAGAVVSAIFPKYFAYGTVLGLVAMVTRLVGGAAWGTPGQRAGTVLLVVATLLSAVQALVLTPAMDEAKRNIPSFGTPRGNDPHRARFARLHGISMVLNLAVLLAGAALITGAAFLEG